MKNHDPHRAEYYNGAENDHAPRSDCLEAELAIFERAERQRLGLQERPIVHYSESRQPRFSKAQRPTTTILVGGLSRTQDLVAAAGFRGLGYKSEALDIPDQEAFRIGKEFCNRGECNPAYFTVGNLVKYLMHLRDDIGLSTQEIIDRYVFLTAGACGPCRFGVYATEYRKAVREAGFDGFRILLFQQQGGPNQIIGEDTGLEFNPAVFRMLIRMVAVGDVVNLMGYRIRPYEVEAGATDAAIAECQRVLIAAFENSSSVLRALWQCRRLLAAVKVDRTRTKPKVSLVGEFWAINTEGDGNYKLQRFLEAEGVEVDIQPVTTWLLYMLWHNRWDTRRRMDLKIPDHGRKGLAGKHPHNKLFKLWAAEKALRILFWSYAEAIGLPDSRLPSMDMLARLAEEYYDLHLRGGEGHLEVAKFLDTVHRRSAQMVISAKPFGCMPSSGISDGVQSLVKAKHPAVTFTSIETTGDAAVAAYSRIQMDLFKAHLGLRAEAADEH
jgi:predicted nucleotide-binding protein (sugar kinase/HSP70/actin superfamily)